MVARLFLLLLLFSLAAGCSRPTSMPVDVTLPSETRTVFVAPFETAMVPPEVEEGLFDRLIDLLNEQGRRRGLEFIILKQGVEGIDGEWLKGQHYVTGEILGYVEDSGCCSTAIRLRGRARLHYPGGDRPPVDVEVPRETFFEHDYSTLEAERRKLTDAIASDLAERLLSAVPLR